MPKCKPVPPQRNQEKRKMPISYILLQHNYVKYFLSDYQNQNQGDPRVSPLNKKLKLDRLAEMVHFLAGICRLCNLFEFPHVLPATIENCFNHYKQMDPTIELLTQRYGPPKEVSNPEPRNTFVPSNKNYAYRIDSMI